MANMMEKIGEKLHMGGHKKDEPQPANTLPSAGYHGSGDPAAHAGPGVTPATTGAAPAGHQQQQGGLMQNLKNKVKGKVHGEDGSSSSSSESDGEGGRRKKIGGKKHGIF